MVVVYLKSWARSGLFKESEREGSRGGTRTRTSGRWSFTSQASVFNDFLNFVFLNFVFCFFFFLINSLVKATSQKKTITFLLASFIRYHTKDAIFCPQYYNFLAFSLFFSRSSAFWPQYFRTFSLCYIYIYIYIRLYYFCLIFIRAKF